MGFFTIQPTSQTPSKAIILKKQPAESKDVLLYLYRAYAYEALGDKQNAYQDYRTVVNLPPDNEKTLARAREGRGNTRRVFYKNEKEEIDRRTFYENTEGAIKASIDDYKEALKLYEKYEMLIDVQRVRKSLIRQYKDLIVLYEEQKKTADAQEARNNLNLLQP